MSSIKSRAEFAAELYGLADVLGLITAIGPARFFDLSDPWQFDLANKLCLVGLEVDELLTAEQEGENVVFSQQAYAAGV